METFVVVAPDGLRIGLANYLEDDDDRTEQEANAVMFAAAPELLAALRDVEGWMQMHIPCFPNPSSGDWEMLGVVQEAISKAEGK